jgi:hypothetical protein
MPTEFIIDSQHSVVISRGSGVFTREDYFDHMSRLGTDPRFSPDFDQIVDCRAFEDLRLTGEEIRELAEKTIFGVRSRRAFVVSSEVQYGLTRMFASYREIKEGQETRVFRDIRDAYSWLDLSPDSGGAHRSE